MADTDGALDYAPDAGNEQETQADQGQQDKTPTFDEPLQAKAYQAEFNRRVSNGSLM